MELHIRATQKLFKIKRKFAKKHHLELRCLQFNYCGKLINDADTPESLGIQNNGRIEVIRLK